MREMRAAADEFLLAERPVAGELSFVVAERARLQAELGDANEIIRTVCAKAIQAAAERDAAVEAAAAAAAAQLQGVTQAHGLQAELMRLRTQLTLASNQLAGTACAPHAHRMCTACAPHAHRMRTACALQARAAAPS